jgi:hypothetical protein
MKRKFNSKSSSETVKRGKPQSLAAIIKSPIEQSRINAKLLDEITNALQGDDISELGYTDNSSYKTQEQKEDVLEKVDWVLLKLHKIKDKRKYDYDIVTSVKNKIKFSDCSLTIKGVEFLNLITDDLKQDIF